MSEVIIDGVNVAECEFLGKYNVCKAYVYMPKSCGCDYNPDCYFKQLQRAKAENKKLKEKLEQWQKFLSKGVCDCEVNERLREENKKLKQIADKALNDKNNLLDNYSNLLEENEKLKAELDNYKRLD